MAVRCRVTLKLPLDFRRLALLDGIGCRCHNRVQVHQGTYQLTSILGGELGLSSRGATVAFTAVLDQEAVELQLEVVRDSFVQELVGGVPRHSRIGNPLVLLGDPVDVRVDGEFVPSEGKEQNTRDGLGTQTLVAEEVLLDGLVGFFAQVFEGDTPGFLVDCLAQQNNVGGLDLCQPAAVDRGLDPLLVSVEVVGHQTPIGHGLFEVSKGPRAVGSRGVLGQHGGKDAVQEVGLIATITGFAGAFVTAASDAIRNNIIFDNVLVDLAIAGYVCGNGGSLTDFTAFLYHVRMEFPEFPHGEFTLLGGRPILYR